MMSELDNKMGKCAVVIKGLPSDFADIALRFYLENISDDQDSEDDNEVHVTDINRSKAIAIAEFERHIDIVLLQTKADAKPFCEKHLAFEALQAPTKVIVTGIPACTTLDSLVLQYEALVKDDIDETASFICSDNPTALLTFENPKAVETLLATKHQISGCDVAVEAWTPTWQNPDEVSKEKTNINENNSALVQPSTKTTQIVKPFQQLHVSSLEDHKIGRSDDKSYDKEQTEEEECEEELINSVVGNIVECKRTRSVSTGSRRSGSCSSSSYYEEEPFREGGLEDDNSRGNDTDYSRPAKRRGRPRRRRAGRGGHRGGVQGIPNYSERCDNQPGNYQQHDYLNQGNQQAHWSGRGGQGGPRWHFPASANVRGRGEYYHAGNVNEDDYYMMGRGRGYRGGNTRGNPSNRHSRGNNYQQSGRMHWDQQTNLRGRRYPNHPGPPRGHGWRGRGQQVDNAYPRYGNDTPNIDPQNASQDQRQVQQQPVHAPFGDQEQHSFKYKNLPTSDCLSQPEAMTRDCHQIASATSPAVGAVPTTPTKEPGYTDIVEFKEDMKTTPEKLKLLHECISTNPKLSQLTQKLRIDFGKEQVFISDTQVKIQLLEILTQMVEWPLKSITPAIGKFLVKNKENIVQGKLKSEGIIGILFLKNGAPCVLGINDKDANAAEKVISKILIQKVFVVDEQQLHMLKQPEWKAAKSSLKGEVFIEETCSKTAQTTITLSGVEEPSIATALTCLQELLRENAKTSARILMGKGCWMFMKDRCTLEFLALKKMEYIKSQNLIISFGKAPDGYSVDVSGFSTDVEAIVCRLKTDICPRIKTESLKVSKPGIHPAQFMDTKEHIQVDQISTHNKCVIEVASKQGQKPGQERNQLTTGLPTIPNHQDGALQGAVGGVAIPSNRIDPNLISVVKGDITANKAEMLVCSVLADATSLSGGGAVSKAFHTVGGSHLERDFQQICAQNGGCLPIGQVEIVVVGKPSKLQCNLVAFVAVKRFRPEHPRQLSALKKMFVQCLDVAEQYNLQSIAFPTIGCGGLKFPPQEVAACFKDAVITWKTKNGQLSMQISVVAYDDAGHRAFLEVISSVTGAAQGQLPVQHVAQKVQFPCLVFSITAMSSKSIDVAKKQLESLVESLISCEEIRSQAIRHLSPKQSSSLLSYETRKVSVTLDEKRGIIKLEGERAALVVVKAKADELVREAERAYEKNKSSPEYIKANHGLSAFLTTVAGDQSVPSHWKNFSGNKLVDAIKKHIVGKEHKVKVTQGLFVAIQHMMEQSWQSQYVGLGRDARGQSGSRVKVRNIWQIENPQMFHDYASKRTKLCVKCSTQSFPPIKGLKREKEVVTRTIGHPDLNKLLVPEINEYFLFHGTQAENAEAIAKQGLDNRIGNTGGLYGKGAYFAESATKADQYAGGQNMQRSQMMRGMMGQMIGLQGGLPSSYGGNTKHMFLCRVLLGSAYVCDKPQPYMRPPCLKLCPGNCSHGQFFDSVIGLANGQQARLNFREFIVYDKDQCYPDFWIEYETV